MTGIETKQTTLFSSRKNSPDKKFGFESFTAKVEYRQTFGTMEFFSQSHHGNFIGVPEKEGCANGHNAENHIPMGNTKAALPRSDSSVFTRTPDIEVFQTDVQHCNSQMCLACRPSRFDYATRFLRVPKVAPSDIPKLPSKWWSEQSFDSNWMDRFWTSMTRIMDGEACGPVKYCGSESIKCKKSCAVHKYERDKH